MNLYYNTVSKPLLACLQKLMENDVFNQFVLVGGTALSLQLGHRTSVDIAAMKMQAIANNKRKKDFWDIHELLEHFTLEEMIHYGLQRNPSTLKADDITKSLCKAYETSQDSVIECLKGKYWELIVDDLRIAAEQYKKQQKQ